MNPSSLTDAIRYAVESAHVPQSDADGSRSVEDTVFTTQARQRLQQLIQTTEHLQSAREACAEELLRQVSEKNFDAAVAAVSLKEQLPQLCLQRKNYVMDPDGTLRRVE